MDSTTAFDLFTALDVLGLAWPCTLDQLKAAYRRRSITCRRRRRIAAGLYCTPQRRATIRLRAGRLRRTTGRTRPDPTADQFGAYRAAFDYFNERLFAGALPRCLLNFSRKSKRTRGFFAPHRWEGDGGRTHDARLYTEDDVHAVEAYFRARAAEGERTRG